MVSLLNSINTKNKYIFRQTIPYMILCLNMIQFKNLGQKEYSEAYKIQKEEKLLVKEKKSDGSIFFLEHPPVITIGTNVNEKNLLFSKNYIISKGFDIIKSTRGGDITVHEPGQLVIYFIIPLKQKTVKKFVNNIIYIIKDAINNIFDLDVKYDENRPGLWIKDTKKICSIGFNLQGKVSTHGIALNINNNLEGFKLINPCGFNNIEMTSIKKELKLEKDIDTKKFISYLKERFEKGL